MACSATLVFHHGRFGTSLLKQRTTSKMIKCSLFGGAAFCFVLAGCDAPEAAPLASIIPEEAVSEPHSAADLDWAKLFSGIDVTTQLEGETSFERFILDVELSNQRRRELGLKFWRDHPDDPRRYKWLILATHLAPYYPSDLNTWAEQAAELGDNADAVDIRALRAWQAIYPKLRAAFWRSGQVSNSQRRYLWFGELEQRLLCLIRSVERGQPADATGILKEIVAYTEEYPKPFSEDDRAHYEWTIVTLVEKVLESADAFGISISNRADFHDAITNGVMRNMEFQTIDDEKWSAFIAARDVVNVAAGQQAPNPWHRLPGDYSYEGRPLPILFYRPNSPESRFVYEYKREVLARRYRAQGLVLWEAHPDAQERMFWLTQTVKPWPRYMSSISQGAAALAEDDQRGVQVDYDALSQWQQLYPRLRAEVWSDPAVSDKQRGILRFEEVRTALLDIRHGRSSHDRVTETLAGIHELWTEYGLWFQARRLAANYVVREPGTLGMTNEVVAAFLEPMLKYDHESLRNLAEGWFRSQELWTTPLDFSAPTLDGEAFDLSDLRGKIVLMKYWSTYCASCIAAMPEIDRVYGEYRDGGFEVISVSFDAESKRERVEQIGRRFGLTWTTLNAESQWDEANARFGWGNVLPAYMLLDRDGRLVAGTEEVDHGKNLRALLDGIMAAEESAGSALQ